MENFVIRKIAAGWGFNSNNEAIWKCSDISKLKVSQDGESVKKKDNSGATIFQFNRNKSARISFNAVVWGLNLVSVNASSSIEEPHTKIFHVPYTQSWMLSADDIARGYVELDHIPTSPKTICFHKLANETSIERPYRYNSITPTCHSFSYDMCTTSILLPRNCCVGDFVETIYEYSTCHAVRLQNKANQFSETCKVRFLMLASPLCDTDRIFAIWLTAKKALADVKNDITFELEEELSMSFELGFDYCDEEKELYEIVMSGDNPLEPNERKADPFVIYRGYNSICSVRVVHGKIWGCRLSEGDVFTAQIRSKDNVVIVSKDYTKDDIDTFKGRIAVMFTQEETAKLTDDEYYLCGFIDGYVVFTEQPIQIKEILEGE